MPVTRFVLRYCLCATIFLVAGSTGSNMAPTWTLVDMALSSGDFHGVVLLLTTLLTVADLLMSGQRPHAQRTVGGETQVTK